MFVVDDATINRKICARKVSKLLPSVEITQCANGKSCIEEYEHDHANIMGIFLDYHMPGMDGDIVARNIREFESLHEEVKTPVWIVDCRDRDGTNGECTPRSHNITMDTPEGDSDCIMCFK